MKEYSMNVRQVCFWCAAMLPAIKLITLPSSFAYYAKDDLILSAFFNAVISLGVLCLVLLTAKRSDKTFLELVRDKFGKIFTRIFAGIYALFFFMLSVLFVLEQKGFTETTFFDIPSTAFGFAPFFLLSFYLCLRDFRSVGRSADVVLPLFAIGLGLLLSVSVGSGDYLRILPFGGNDFSETWKGTVKALAWFADPLWILFFVGRFRYEEKCARKILISYAAGVTVFLLFLWLFYAVFADIAIRQIYAISRIGQFSEAIQLIGRVDFFAVCMIAAATLLQAILPIQLATKCLAYAVRLPVWASALIVNISLFGLIFLAGNSFSFVQKFICGDMLWSILLFAFALPACSPLLTIGKQR